MRMSKIVRKYVDQLESDLDDLRSLYFFTRCPCCTHLVHNEHICNTCGCDDGVYADGYYSKEEIAEMKAKK